MKKKAKLCYVNIDRSIVLIKKEYIIADIAKDIENKI